MYIQNTKNSNDIKGTQFVFLDFGMTEDTNARYGFNLYADITRKLIAEGIPTNEIANIADYKSISAKEELFRQVNAGEIRVLLGSTARMGEGMNAQKRAVALHHLNPPYRPSDIEQREGRLIRFGNINKNVSVYRYIQKRSFDSYMWQMLSRKAEFINQAMSDGSVNELEEVSEFVLSANEAKAIASDNPLLLEKAGLDDKLATLKAKFRNFEFNRWEAQSVLEKSPAYISGRETVIKQLIADIATVERNPFPKDGFEMTVKGKRYSKHKEAGEALLKEIQSNMLRLDTTHEVGTLRGMSVKFKRSIGQVRLYVEGSSSTDEIASESDVGNIQKLIHIIDKFPGRVTALKQLIESQKKAVQEAKETLTNVFPEQAEFDDVRQKLSRIDAELNLSANGKRNNHRYRFNER